MGGDGQGPSNKPTTPTEHPGPSHQPSSPAHPVPDSSALPRDLRSQREASKVLPPQNTAHSTPSPRPLPALPALPAGGESSKSSVIKSCASQVHGLCSHRLLYKSCSLDKLVISQ